MTTLAERLASPHVPVVFLWDGGRTDIVVPGATCLDTAAVALDAALSMTTGRVIVVVDASDNPDYVEDCWFFDTASVTR